LGVIENLRWRRRLGVTRNFFFFVSPNASHYVHCATEPSQLLFHIHPSPIFGPFHISLFVCNFVFVCLRALSLARWDGNDERRDSLTAKKKSYKTRRHKVVSRRLERVKREFKKKYGARKMRIPRTERWTELIYSPLIRAAAWSRSESSKNQNQKEKSKK